VNSDPLWYKDAIIYQLHVKAFFDANDDGMGDFAGLTQRLDYIRDLGATALWLLPFYPSPLRDDGYDISEYKAINPAYGSMHDFRAFVRAAHERDLRVITELVINHTSDQHPWFQRARRAKPGSAYRDFYVWSDTDTKYAGTRIIFTDSETSNWAWDPVAGQYYWHRFFSHQPDLNFANPRVIRAVTDVMRFWLDAGVDGMRLDAVPYLCERDGTSNENLPETHGVLKILRAVLDHEHRDKIFLAEANQWPEDVRSYFGDGDECHMAFHFPLMPRMFMAIAEEDRYPIVDIMRQTPEIPPTCQWAIFLRNHDEMTLEMVTERERDYMYKVYASDPQARVNIGIRRRLAPLMENDRRRIELLTGLLLSMPGTPILYYGDEIGMGDNIFLGDRSGVRTPMQWSIDRNGGFSRTDPARLYLPPIMDPVYGYQSVNVEAQMRSPSSLLSWLRKLIAVRQGYKAFGRGSLAFLTPANRKVIAYVREYEGEAILCVANLARSAQPVSLDLSRWKGRVPVEMVGWSPFPTVGDDRYTLTLPAHAFFWFLLSDAAVTTTWNSAEPEPMPELQTLVLARENASLLGGRTQILLESEILPAYIPKQRWYAESDAPVRVSVLDALRVDGANGFGFLALASVSTRSAGPTDYFLPLAVASAQSDRPSAALLRATLARTRSGPREGLLIDGFASDAFALALVADIRQARKRVSTRGAVVAVDSPLLADVDLGTSPSVRVLEVEQANSSLVIGERVLLKAYRRPLDGPEPELEISRYLSRVGFAHVPALLGSIEYVPNDGPHRALCIAQSFVESQGDGWSATLTYLGRALAERAAVGAQNGDAAADPHAISIQRARLLGSRLAELHRAFALTTGDPAFDPEPVQAEDVAGWVAGARDLATSALDRLGMSLERLPAELRASARSLLERRDQAVQRIEDMRPDLTGTVKTRYHGDLHLGNLLVVAGDAVFVGFGGRYGEPLAQRRAKSSPLRDVARMLRSFNYAAVAAVRGLTMDRSEDVSALEPLAREWERRSGNAFLTGYDEGMADCPSYPRRPHTARALLDLFLTETAFVEMLYELENRPSWVRIPLEGLGRTLEDAAPVGA